MRDPKLPWNCQLSPGATLGAAKPVLPEAADGPGRSEVSGSLEDQVKGVAKGRRVAKDKQRKG